MTRQPIVLLSAVALAAGCIGNSPEAQREVDLGPEEPGVERGPDHRPGQPCLACHSPEHDPGDAHFLLAGTVYLRPDDERGLEDAQVQVQDAAGRRFTARTNRVGNFYVRKGGGEGPSQRGRGELRVPWQPELPLRVSVRSGDLERSMQGLIWREGSCAACHAGPPSATSNGPIYLEAP